MGLTLGARPAMAQEHADRSGFYLTAGVGAGRWHGSVPTECITYRYQMETSNTYCIEPDDGASSFVGRFGGGWRVNDLLSFEAAYMYLGYMPFTRKFVGIPGPNSSTSKGSLEIDGLDVSAIGSLPLTPTVALTGRAGVFLFHQDYTPWDATA